MPKKDRWTPADELSFPEPPSIDKVLIRAWEEPLLPDIHFVSLEEYNFLKKCNTEAWARAMHENFLRWIIKDLEEDDGHTEDKG